MVLMEMRVVGRVIKKGDDEIEEVCVCVPTLNNHCININLNKQTNKQSKKRTISNFKRCEVKIPIKGTVRYRRRSCSDRYRRGDREKDALLDFSFIFTFLIPRFYPYTFVPYYRVSHNTTQHTL